MQKKVKLMVLNALPVLLMVGLIPFVQNDYLLTAIYLLIIATSLIYKRYSKDLLAFFLGLFIMTLSEYLFIRTGVETFNRNSLFGLMPLWLPLLWAYGFVVIKRYVVIILGPENFLIRILSFVSRLLRI